MADKYSAEKYAESGYQQRKEKEKQEKKHASREMRVENLIRINRQFFGLTENRKKRFAWKVQLGKDLR